MDDSKELKEQSGAAPEEQQGAQAPPGVQAEPGAAAADQPVSQPAAAPQQPVVESAGQSQQPVPQITPVAQQSAAEAAPQLVQQARQAVFQTTPQFGQSAPQVTAQAEQPASQAVPQAQQPAAQAAPQAQQQNGASQDGAWQSGPSQGGAAQGSGAHGGAQSSGAQEKNSVFGLMFKVLFSPGLGMEAVARERRIGSAIFIVLLLALFNLLVGTLAINDQDLREIAEFIELYGSDQQFFIAVTRQMTLVFGIVLAFLQVLFLFVRAGFYKLLGEMVGERNGYDGLTMVATLGYAAMPTIFAPVLNMISSLLGHFALSFFFSLIIWGWGAVLTVFAIKAALQCSGGKAFLIYVIPLAIMFLIGMMAFVLFTVGVMFAPEFWYY